jgi:molybdopterin molybdotransferase
MLTVDEALQRVLDHCRPLPARPTPLDEALGAVLAEDIQSDIDSPPHDKSMVDGYAIVAADLAGGSAELTVLEEVVAGANPTRSVQRGQATRIMTGAPVPPGADAVVMIERTQLRPSGTATGIDKVHIVDAPAGPRQNILPQGTSMRRGDVVLKAETPLRAVEIGLLAEVGRDPAPIVPRPRVAILSTGNELVPASEIPGAGQIRNSNGPMLAACVKESGSVVIPLGIGRDDIQELRRLIQRGLEADVLVLSGGVSAGVLDLVPGVLAELGVQQVFHKIRLKPGKPLWFGVLPADSSQPRPDKLVFGLPGNPVSSLVCFELFVRPALLRLSGHTAAKRPFVSCRLAEPLVHRGDRPTYHPASSTVEEGTTMATPLRWRGSADLRALTLANSLIHFPAGDRNYQAGDVVDILWL